jgi:hypothetical protein
MIVLNASVLVYLVYFFAAIIVSFVLASSFCLLEEIFSGQVVFFLYPFTQVFSWTEMD